MSKWITCIRASLVVTALLLCCAKVPIASNSLIEKVTATSSLNESYGPGNVIDGTWRPWVAGKKKDGGIGEALTLAFKHSVKIEQVFISNGYGKPERFWRNNRISLMEVSSPGEEPVAFSLKDDPGFQRVDLPRIIEGKTFTFTIKGVYNGDRDNDTCLSEISFDSAATDNMTDSPGKTGSGLFIAIGYKNIFTSQDGIEWVKTNTPTSLEYCRDMACGGGICVAVGAYGSISLTKDGVHWNRVIDKDEHKNNLTGVAFGNNTFIAVGQGRLIMRSGNGFSWYEESEPGVDLYSIAWGKDTFVAVGANGCIKTSRDGKTWTLAVFKDSFYKKMCFGNGIFVAVGANGRIDVSENGSAWRNVMEDKYCNLYGIAFGNGKFVVTGTHSTTRVSSNGIDWVDVTANIPIRHHIRHVAFGNNRFVACGEGGIFTSKDAIVWRIGVKDVSVESGLTYWDRGKY